jgi:hypothetical protein
MNHNTKKAKSKTATGATRMSMDEYRERLHEYNQKFLLCKDIRHVWKVQTTYTAFEKNPEWVQRTLICARCGTVRTDNFHIDAASQRMERGVSSYRYPAGFSLRGLPKERNLSEVMRYESFLRAIAANPQEKK